MLLQDLPSAILRQLLNGERSWCALELYKCGSRALNTRLANKGVTHIELNDGAPATSGSWPQCLSQFALEEISMDRGHLALGPAAMREDALKKLPTTLRALQLRASGLVEAVFPKVGEKVESSKNLPLDASDDLERPSKRSKSVENEDANILHLSRWSMDVALPHLERLVVRDRFASPIDALVLASLPRSLTWLEFRIRIKGQDLSCLPSGLKTLLLIPSSIDLQSLLTLPKSLTNVGDGLDHEALSKVITSPDTLPLLEEFEFPQRDFGVLPNPFQLLEQGHHLPQALQSLTIGFSGTARLLRDFPPTLTHLCCTSGIALRAQEVVNLPRSLTSLQVLNVAWKDLTVNDLPNLRSLVLDSSANFSYNSFALLPRSLKILRFGDLDRDQYHLPLAASLPTLKASGQQCLALDRERWSIEKDRLLRMGAEAYIKKVEDGELFGLPLGLTELFFPQPVLHHLLPPLILSTKFYIALDDANAFEILPPSSAFHVSVPNVIPIADAPNDANQPFDATSTALYNSKITSLEILFLFPLFPEGCIQYLPRGLRQLELQATVRASELKLLPPTLEQLDLNEASFTDDDDDWLKTLPRGLTVLVIPQAKIYGSDIIHLPPKLEFVRAMFVYVTLAQARAMPRQLSTIIVARGDHGTAEGYLSDKDWAALKLACRPFWRIREYSETYLASELKPDSIPPLGPLRDDVYPVVARRYAFVR